MQLFHSIRSAAASRQIHELVKYLIVGGANAIITCAIYLTCLNYFNMHYLLALASAFIFGNLFTYFLNFVWVFRPELNFTFRERFFKYFASNFGTFSLNIVALYYAVEEWAYDPFRAQLVLMLIIVSANFCFAKFWSLRAESFK